MLDDCEDLSFGLTNDLSGASFAAHEARRTYERKLNIDDEGLRADVV